MGTYLPQVNFPTSCSCFHYRANTGAHHTFSDHTLCRFNPSNTGVNSSQPDKLGTISLDLIKESRVQPRVQLVTNCFKPGLVLLLDQLTLSKSPNSKLYLEIVVIISLLCHPPKMNLVDFCSKPLSTVNPNISSNNPFQPSDCMAGVSQTGQHLIILVQII